MNKLISKLRWVFLHKNPYRLMVAYMLRRLGVSKYFVIDKGMYRFKYYPSGLLMHLWADNYSREDEVFFLQKLIKINSCVLDIGANVGTLTLPLSYGIGKSGRIISVEAHPKTFEILKHNIDYNPHLKNINIVNCAVGDKKGEIKFSSIGSDDMNKVISDSSQKTIMVKMDTIDNICKQYNVSKIRLLKIDIEGYELFALKGAQNILKFTDIVYFESAEQHFISFGYSTKDIVAYLLKQSFSVYRIEDNNFIEIFQDYISLVPENLIAFKNKQDINCIIDSCNT